MKKLSDMFAKKERPKMPPNSSPKASASSEEIEQARRVQ